MYLALYRKYRPTKFEDVVGQNQIVKIISAAIEQGKVSHAYLFAGPRGTGKTTMAKLIAKIVNCKNLQPNATMCGQCDNCLNVNNEDIIEIDAASNNGVDEIRELRDKVNLVPANSKYKIYIIDEVHMLTTQAFNALLKTLEEPPAHIIFILATTELQKVPITVLSRCQRFQFHKISSRDIVDRLKYILTQEQSTIAETVLYEIARASDGGMRDAISLLDQLLVTNDNDITVEDVYNLKGTISYQQVYLLLNDIKKGNNLAIMEFVDNVNGQGKNIRKILEEMILYLKDMLYIFLGGEFLLDNEKYDFIKQKTNIFSDKQMFYLMEKLEKTNREIKVSDYPHIIFEVALLDISSNFQDNVDNVSIIRENEQKPKLSKDNGNSVIMPLDKKDMISNEKKSIRINNAFANASKMFLSESTTKWLELKDYLLDKKYKIVAGLLNDCQVVVASTDHLLVTTPTEAVALRINELIEETDKFVSSIYLRDMKLVAVTKSEWDDLKKEYIQKIKSGYKYVKITAKEENNDIINVQPQNDLVSIFGEEIIEYK